MVRKLLLIITVFLFMGCSKIFNPYESEFMCPDVPVGKCADMDEAYQESLDHENELVIKKKKCIGPDCKKNKNEYAKKKQDVDYHYKDRLYETYAQLLDSKDKTPLLVPPKTVRTLIIYYPDDNGKVLFGNRFVYFMVGEPKFILDQE